MPPLTLTAFVDREARYLGGYLGGAAVKAAAAAPNKRPPSSGGRGVNVNPDVSAIVSAIEMDAAYGSRPSSSASSVRSPVISPDCLDPPRRFQYAEDLALHASAHHGAASSLPTGTQPTGLATSNRQPSRGTTAIGYVMTSDDL